VLNKKSDFNIFNFLVGSSLINEEVNNVIISSIMVCNGHISFACLNNFSAACGKEKKNNQL